MSRHEVLLERVRAGALKHSAYWSTFVVPAPRPTRDPFDFRALASLYERLADEADAIAQDESRSPYYRGVARRTAMQHRQRVRECEAAAEVADLFPCEASA